MLDLLMNRRSIRKYKDQELSKEIIDKIIQAALTAPSGRNKKPWELVVVTDKEILTKLGNARGPASWPMKNAPLGFVILADPEVTDLWIEDSSILATVIQLTAQSLGLGSCWLQVRERLSEDGKEVEENAKEILSIPNNYRVEAMISIGYPDEKKEAHKIETLKFDKVHYNKF
ncbi:MAG: NAD(P)H nitroreductase [Tissierellia bacterium]|nr:NAD(P)H nitroreductase [Tissierellia bacterium]